MNQELLRIVDALARDKNIDKEILFEDLEAAMYSAIRKANADTEDVEVRINRESGEISAEVDGEPMAMKTLGRIAAQTAKQVMIQRIREAERGSLYDEFLERRGQIVTGKIARWEGGSLVVELPRAEAFLPKSEQIPGDSHRPDDRIRAMVLDVRESPAQVKIILSRSHPDFIRALFELEVPEVGEGIIQIQALAREAGYRTKVAVHSLDAKVDAVGACVGIRGSRIRSIVDELGGEKIDIVRWNESSKMLIANALKPAEVAEIALCFELGRATVVVTEDQLSLAIGKRGQNVRLAARLTGWDIDILTPGEFNAGLDTLEKALRKIEGMDSTMIDKVVAMGMVNVLDVEEVGPDPLVNELGMERGLAQKVVVQCAQEARRVAEEQAAAKEAARQEEQARSAGAASASAKADEGPTAEASEPGQAGPEADTLAAGGSVEAPPAGAASASEGQAPETVEQEQTTESPKEPAGGEVPSALEPEEESTPQLGETDESTGETERPPGV